MIGGMAVLRTTLVAIVLALGGSVAALAQGFSLPRAEVQISTDCDDGCPAMVTLPSGLRMSQNHITRAQFALFAKDTGFKRNGWGCAWNFPGIEQEDDQPALCISYEDAMQYIDWLSARAGTAYRLPTVEEYRAAASGGQSFNYWWGEDVGENRANCIGCKSDYDGKGTSPVDNFPANPYGLGDAVGNAWQWTSDCDDANCTQHALIGGSWSSPPADLRLSKLIWNKPQVPFYTYGLRVVSDAQ